MYNILLSRGSWIGFSKPLARSLKSIDAALLLSEILNQIEYFKQDEVFITHNHFEEQILLSSHKVRKAAKILIDNNLIVIERKGVPAKNYYKLHKSFTSSIENLLSLDIKKFNNCKLKNSTTINDTREMILDNNISTKIEKSEILETDNDFIDFNELQKQNKKIGISGQIKAIVQSELNYLTFDSFDNKIIDRMIKSIIANLTAFKRKKKDFTKTTNNDIVEAFKTALNSIISKSVETPTLSYVNSCLNPNLYIKELQQNNETDSDLEEYKAVVKKIFSHYHRFTKSDLNNLKTIIKAIEETGSKDVLFDFKFIMNNLPDYISESISLQSISYLANKINDLVRTCSLEAKIRSHEQFILISQPFGEKRAYEILTKRLTKNLL